MIQELIRRTRSYRRFDQEHVIGTQTLESLIELARQGGSARNVQPLKYITVSSWEINEKIFPLLGWAGYLSDWAGPAEGERPTAYIICLGDQTIAPNCQCDLGIATQNILLGATELGLGGCRIGSFSPGIRKILDIPPEFELLLVIALGKPVEQVVIDDCPRGGDIRYWRDVQSIHHVPKRSLEEILIKRF